MASGTRTRSTERQPQTSSKRQPQAANKRQPQTRTRQRIAGLQRLFHDTMSEMRKITWPDKDTTRNLTLVVIAISVVLGLLLGGVDAAFVRLWNLIP